MTKKLLAVIWPGYRKFNRPFWQLLCNDQQIKPSVLWIRPFRDDDSPPSTLLSEMEWDIVGADNIRVSGYNVRLFIKLCQKIWRTIKKNDVVLTSTQAPVHSKVAFFIAKIQRKPIGIILEQWRDTKVTSTPKRLYKKLDKVLLQHADIIFTHGINQKNYAKALGVSSDKITILPFLSDDLQQEEITNPDLKKELGMGTKKIILYFGRITPQKGLSDLIHACSQILDSMENVILLVCGGADKHFLDFQEAGPYMSTCHNLAEKLLPGKVIFTGAIPPDKKQDYFAIADIFVHPHTNIPYLAEGWGLVLNEAASMGLPIITTDRVGSAPDLVTHGKSGYILPAGDISELAKSIKTLLDNKIKRKEFSIFSRKLFENYHQPDKIPRIIKESLFK